MKLLLTLGLISSTALGDSALNPWVNERLIGSPEPSAPYTAVRAFEKFPVKRPVALELEPGTNQILLLENYAWSEKPSVLRRFSPVPEVSDAEALLELSEPVYSIGFPRRFYIPQRQSRTKC